MILKGRRPARSYGRAIVGIHSGVEKVAYALGFRQLGRDRRGPVGRIGPLTCPGFAFWLGEIVVSEIACCQPDMLITMK